jgi:hypothetical protein
MNDRRRCGRGARRWRRGGDGRRGNDGPGRPLMGGREKRERKQPHAGQDEHPIPLDAGAQPRQRLPERRSAASRRRGRRRHPTLTQLIAFVQPSPHQLRKGRFDDLFGERCISFFHWSAGLVPRDRDSFEETARRDCCHHRFFSERYQAPSPREATRARRSTESPVASPAGGHRSAARPRATPPAKPRTTASSAPRRTPGMIGSSPDESSDVFKLGGAAATTAISRP